MSWGCLVVPSFWSAAAFCEMAVVSKIGVYILKIALHVFVPHVVIWTTWYITWIFSCIFHCELTEQYIKSFSHLSVWGLTDLFTRNSASRFLDIELYWAAWSVLWTKVEIFAGAFQTCRRLEWWRIHHLQHGSYIGSCSFAWGFLLRVHRHTRKAWLLEEKSGLFF